jgi:hypothetical protein
MNARIRWGAARSVWFWAWLYVSVVALWFVNADLGARPWHPHGLVLLIGIALYFLGLERMARMKS